MNSQLIKLAYQLGYKAAQAASAPLFDPKTGRPLQNFAENFSMQETADSPWTLGAVGAGSAYMAGRNIFRNPINVASKQLQKAKANFDRAVATQAAPRRGLGGWYDRTMNSLVKNRQGKLINSREAKLLAARNKLKTLQAMKPSMLGRFGKAAPWAAAAALALGALAYRNDMI